MIFLGSLLFALCFVVISFGKAISFLIVGISITLLTGIAFSMALVPRLAILEKCFSKWVLSLT